MARSPISRAIRYIRFECPFDKLDNLLGHVLSSRRSFLLMKSPNSTSHRSHCPFQLFQLKNYFFALASTWTPPFLVREYLNEQRSRMLSMKIIVLRLSGLTKAIPMRHQVGPRLTILRIWYEVRGTRARVSARLVIHADMALASRSGMRS